MYFLIVSIKKTGYLKIVGAVKFPVFYLSLLLLLAIFAILSAINFILILSGKENIYRKQNL